MFSTTSAYAQQSQMLSVTPPLFQLSVAPGDIWQSAIKVVNGNDYPLTVYAEVVNFESNGENGQGRFTPLNESEIDRASLASWITIPKGPYVIPPEQTTEISFFVDVPKDAPPGGHFAAILIGTKPPEDSPEKLRMSASLAVTSLFFARIEGEIVEEATIREFSVTERSIELPEAEFSLRFENKGNVHLQPRGDIVITNMWGKERGIVPVNNHTHFGNVLPKSIRNFIFSWKGERSFSDIGRYKAVATLAYGEDGVKNVSSVTYFWVIPVKATLITVAILVCFILLVTWMIRRYVRNVLLLAGVEIDKHTSVKQDPILTRNQRGVKKSPIHITSPLREGVTVLQNRLSMVTESLEVCKIIVSFVFQYRLFFGSLVTLIIVFIISALYITNVTTDTRDYQVKIGTESDTDQTVFTADEVESMRK